MDVGSPNVPGGITLEFGVHPNATAGFDLDIDRIAPPSSPPPALRGYLIGREGEPPEDQLAWSFLPRADSLEWFVVLEVAGGERNTTVQVSLSWNVTGVPDSFSQVALLDENDRFLSDMRASGNTLIGLKTSLSGSAEKVLKIRVSKFQTQEIVFKRVWNLISLSVQPPDPRPEVVLKDIIYTSIWAWDRSKQQYVTPTVMVPGQGYWVSVRDEYTQIIQGVAIAQVSESVSTVWNLIGATFTPSKVRLIGVGGPLTSLWRWDSDSQQYIAVPFDDPTDPVLPGFGYWVSTRSSAEIEVVPVGQ
jgi:hypothetical protein